MGLVTESGEPATEGSDARFATGSGARNDQGNITRQPYLPGHPGSPFSAKRHKSRGVADVRDYLRAAEAAALLHVSPKTISRWAKEGRVAHVVTLGGHRRFPRGEIEALVQRQSGHVIEGPPAR